MSFLSKLFGAPKDPLLDNALKVVPAAHMMARTMYLPMIDKDPRLRSVDVKLWDFFMGLAGVFVALRALEKSGLDASRQLKLRSVILKSLREWRPSADRGLEDCRRFVEAEWQKLANGGHALGNLLAVAVGIWVVGPYG